jgi:hypothetical protein
VHMTHIKCMVGISKYFLQVIDQLIFYADVNYVHYYFHFLMLCTMSDPFIVVDSLTAWCSVKIREAL